MPVSTDVRVWRCIQKITFRILFAIPGTLTDVFVLLLTPDGEFRNNTKIKLHRSLPESHQIFSSSIILTLDALQHKVWPLLEMHPQVQE